MGSSKPSCGTAVEVSGKGTCADPLIIDKSASDPLRAATSGSGVCPAPLTPLAST